jgi:hypothetical protein
MKIVYDYDYVIVVSGGLLTPSVNFFVCLNIKQFYEQKINVERNLFLLNKIF